MSEKFFSPLTIEIPTIFSGIDFGSVERTNELRIFSDDLNSRILGLCEFLPRELRSDAKNWIRSYAKEGENFIDLFYIPVWSFLFRLGDKYRDIITPRILELSKFAHSISLFLHLWDDHLCDNQLKTDILKLQLRTQAWNSFGEGARKIANLFHIDESKIQEELFEYLVWMDPADDPIDFKEYSSIFTKQISIWTIVPKLWERALVDQDGIVKGSLSTFIQKFSMAWRYMDDLQDIHLDLMSRKKNSVWFLLDSEQKDLWIKCEKISIRKNELDLPSWEILQIDIKNSGAFSRLVDLIHSLLRDCIQICEQNHWEEMKVEIVQCSNLQGLKS
ncbi:hypothetical protein EHQ52_01605 [Leptospira koniambonensis]|uniref:Uncharacterized protein n=1 Tax=Leptospira koniambonensis TaxID=2484950 RepID=A0A4R9JC61_9LEPT|nr:hypothetical protein [Leptospira koniambonensis]TGL36599.1 hypothetical protein EHQ52_01605 [Leptospira koniambonensis]